MCFYMCPQGHDALLGHSGAPPYLVKPQLPVSQAVWLACCAPPANFMRFMTAIPVDHKSASCGRSQSRRDRDSADTSLRYVAGP
jgi:hypothetical protein